MYIYVCIYRVYTHTHTHARNHLASNIIKLLPMWYNIRISAACSAFPTTKQIILQGFHRQHAREHGVCSSLHNYLWSVIVFVCCITRIPDVTTSRNYSHCVPTYRVLHDSILVKKILIVGIKYKAYQLIWNSVSIPLTFVSTTNSFIDHCVLNTIFIRIIILL